MLRPWKGNELVAGMRWRHWLLMMLLTTPFLLILLLMTLLPFYTGFAGVSLAQFIFFSVVSGYACFLIWLAWHTARAGYVLRMSANGGLSHCLGPKIAWRDIDGVDWELRDHGDTQSNFLVLALKPAAIESLRRPWLRRLLAMPACKLTVSKARLVIACGLIATPPAVLWGAARHLAMRANPDFDPDWIAP
ncbi:MAG: hypothetical protein LBE62_16035 [Azonexus sp.]|nr:hypothetical protein [Azonexus sp.]